MSEVGSVLRSKFSKDVFVLEFYESSLKNSLMIVDSFFFNFRFRF